MVGPVVVLVEGAAEHVVFVVDGRGRVVPLLGILPLEMLPLGIYLRSCLHIGMVCAGARLY